MWSWVEDPDISWIPFVFTFEDASASFEALQWTIYDANAKKEMKAIMRHIDERLRKPGKK